MKKILLITIGLFLTNCSYKVSKHFKNNKYLQDYNKQIINEPLKLYFESPADITYITDRKKLIKILNKKKYQLKNPVLVYGKTDYPPYEFFVTLSKKQTKQNFDSNFVVFDTVINNQMIYFIGKPLSIKSRRTLTADLKSIFNSLKLIEN